MFPVALVIVWAGVIAAGMIAPSATAAPTGPGVVPGAAELVALPPGSLDAGGRAYWLGTDEQGWDVGASILLGLRTSVVVGILATLGSTALGASVALLIATVGGRLESAALRIVDAQRSVPALLLTVLLLGVLGRGTGSVILALVAVQWAQQASVMHVAAREQWSRAHVHAAYGLGVPAWRIALRHVARNGGPLLAAAALAQLAGAMMIEATVSFLGVGVATGEPSLGTMIASGVPALLGGRYWMALFPGLALFAMIASLHVVATRMRCAIDPQPRR